MLKKNLFYNSLLSISQFIFPLITFPYSSRILGPNGIGAVNFIDSFTQYFILFAALGIPLYGVREISKHKENKEELEKTFNEIFLIHIISTGLFASIYLVSAIILPQLRTHLDLVAIGILMMSAGVLSAEWLFQGTEKFSYITFRSLLVRCLSVIFLFVFLRRDSPPIVYYSIMASGITLNGLINIFYLRRTIKIRFVNLELKKHIRPLVIILGSTLAVSVYLLMDNVILGFIKGVREVGIYAVALRIVRLPLGIIGAVNGVILPQISRDYVKKDFAGIQKLIDKSFSLICVTGFPITFGLFVASSFLIQIFGGPKFENSIIALKILAPLVLINGIGNIICIQLLAPMGKEKYLFKSYIIGMVFSLLSNIILIKYFSYKGACIGMVATEIVATAVCYYYLQKIISIKFDYKILSQCLLGVLFFFPIVFIANKFVANLNLNGIVIIAGCGIFYVIYVWFFVKNIYIINIKDTILLKIFGKRL